MTTAPCTRAEAHTHSCGHTSAPIAAEIPAVQKMLADLAGCRDVGKENYVRAVEGTIRNLQNYHQGTLSSQPIGNTAISINAHGAQLDAWNTAITIVNEFLTAVYDMTTPANA